MSTWFSNRSSDRVTQRTSMLESTSELLICFRNTWNWSGGWADGGGGFSAGDGCRGYPRTLAQLFPTGRLKLRQTCALPYHLISSPSKRARLIF